MTAKIVVLAALATAVASPAMSADLARKAPAAVDYVKVCDTYGEGFFYIPGTDTCLKIGGYVRAYAFAGKDDFGNYGSGRDKDSFTTKARLDLQIDARSQTEFGLLRSVGEVRFNFGTPGFDDDGIREDASVSTDLELAYIQWGGFTAGRSQSFFDFFTGYTIEEVYGEVGISDAKTNLFAYTFGFGNGVTATVSLEDPTTSGRQMIGDGYNGYGGLKYPDLVANVNVVQAWGSAQIMGALHNNNSELSGYDSKLGYAIGAGVMINLPMLGAEDQFGIQMAYAKGATGYTGLGNGVYDDDFYLMSGDMYRGSTWSITAGLQHTFTKTVSGAVQVGYNDYDLTDYPYGYEVKTLDLTTSVTWTPVNNLAIDLGIEYRKAKEEYYTVTNKYDGYAVVGRVTRKF